MYFFVILVLTCFSDIESMITTEYSRHPGKSLLESCVRYKEKYYTLHEPNRLENSAIKGRYHDILMDSNMNSRPAIIRNLYELFYIAAMKTEAHSTRLSKSINGFINERLLISRCY